METRNGPRQCVSIMRARAHGERLHLMSNIRIPRSSLLNGCGFFLFFFSPLFPPGVAALRNAGPFILDRELYGPRYRASDSIAIMAAANESANESAIDAEIDKNRELTSRVRFFSSSPRPPFISFADACAHACAHGCTRAAHCRAKVPRRDRAHDVKRTTNV